MLHSRSGFLVSRSHVGNTLAFLHSGEDALMVTPRLRGKNYHLDFSLGRRHLVRGPLSTSNRDVALRLIHRIEIALSEGSSSILWPQLQRTLPRSTYDRLAAYVGVKQQVDATWGELRDKFVTDMDRRVKIGSLAEGSAEGYKRVLLAFEAFLREDEINLLRDIDTRVVKDFRYWRIEQIQKRKGPNAGSGFVTEAALLHRVFEFAVEEGLVDENPVPYEKRGQAAGAQPFDGDELLRLRAHAESDWLTFVVLRWTGLRISDAATLAWDELNFEKKLIQKTTKKSRYLKTAIIPMQTELLSVLKAEHGIRNPQPNDLVLKRHESSACVTTSYLAHRLAALGKRAGVKNVHPHRFRDTFAVDALLSNVHETSVARMLADTPEVVKKHYLHFVEALREQTRHRLDTGTKLEDLANAH